MVAFGKSIGRHKLNLVLFYLECKYAILFRHLPTTQTPQLFLLKYILIYSSVKNCSLICLISTTTLYAFKHWMRAHAAPNQTSFPWSLAIWSLDSCNSDLYKMLLLSPSWFLKHLAFLLGRVETLSLCPNLKRLHSSVELVAAEICMRYRN